MSFIPSFKKAKRYLGVDFGTSSLKVVELEDAGGKPKLVTYGIAEQGCDIGKLEGTAQLEGVARLLKELAKRAKVSTNKVIAGLPGFSIFSSIINLPKMSERELAEAVRWEAKKFIPLELEDVILDWKVLKPMTGAAAESQAGEGKPAHERILLTAAPRALVQKYIDVIQSAELEFVSLETESFALTRSLVGFDPSTVLIIDVGALTTHLSIIEDEIPILHRSLDVGGTEMTRAIALALTITEDRAEQFKRDVGLGGGEDSQGIPEAISHSLDRVVQEASYLLKLYRHDHATGHVEKIILTGGSSYLDG
ncbi:MAG: type IV pilus assembly protein PilM, partial [bacterium]|nr:type IV pilus assembly protein PilM [bacterium]